MRETSLTLVNHAAMPSGQRLLLIACGDQLLGTMVVPVPCAVLSRGVSDRSRLVLFHPAVTTFLVLRAELVVNLGLVGGGVIRGRVREIRCVR